MYERFWINLVVVIHMYEGVNPSFFDGFGNLVKNVLVWRDGILVELEVNGTCRFEKIRVKKCVGIIWEF